jgi:ATP-binding cassette subfamily C protein LapB
MASSLLALGLPIVVLQVYDRVLPNQSGATLLVLTVTLVVIVLLDLGLRLLRADLTAWAAAQYEHRLGLQLSRTILRAPMNLVDRDGPGAQLGRLAAIDAIKSFYCGSAASTLLDLPIVLVSLLLVGFIGGYLVLAPLVLLILFLVIGAFLGKRLHQMLKERSEADDRRWSFLAEVFAGIHSVKALTLEEQMLRRYERLFDGVDPLVHGAAELNTTLRGISDVFSQATIVIVASAAAWLVIDQRLTLGEMAACTLLCGRTLQPALQSLGLWSQFQAVRVARRRLLQGLAMPAEVSGDMRLKLSGALRLEDVVYRHEGAERLLFDRLNLEVAANEFVGIRGGDGVGKTTLIHLLTGLVSPRRAGSPSTTYRYSPWTCTISAGRSAWSAAGRPASTAA